MKNLTEKQQNFIKLCGNIAEWSRDRSSKVGAIAVGPDDEIRSVGYNGFPRGIDDDVEERYERPIKYLFTEHAERNCIYNAARVGIPLKGCTMYLQWFPCANCARAIIQSGIVATKPDLLHERWGDDFKVAKQMFEEAGTKITYYKNTKTDSEKRTYSFISHLRRVC
jgi:dCMP deaminase